MRHAKLLLLPALLFAPLTFAADKGLTTEIDRLSYSLGAKTGENFSSQDIPVNPNQFAKGLSDAVGKKKLLMTEQEMQDTIQKFQEKEISKVTEMNKKLAVVNQEKSNKFLAENKGKPNVKTLSSGLQYIELTPGKGSSPKLGDDVTVNYRGTLIDGTEFDSSYKRKESTTFQLEGLIPGWQEALLMMKPGAKWKIFVPPQLAYGDKGAGRIIEPNSTLIFEIELVNVKPKTGKS